MKKKKATVSIKTILSSVLMVAMLVWLTVCLPFVNASQKAAKAQTEQTGKASSDDNSNPLTNSNEEKSESGTSLLSEYLHEVPVLEHHPLIVASYFKCHPSDLYLAYHPDLIVPPPKV